MSETLHEHHWRLLVTEALPGPINMAIDEAIMKAHDQGLVPPTLRFYAWNPATLTLGYFQSLEREVDVEAVRAREYNVVRRLTGGRAVLHDNEVTYSVVISQKLFPGSVLETYRLLSQGLTAGLRSLGVPAEVVSPRASDIVGNTAACFDAPSRYELTAGGKKLVGSAQTRRGGVLLQHGSIPLTFNLDQVDLLLPGRDDVDVARWRRVLRRTLERKAAGIGDFVSDVPGYSDTVVALVNGFQSALQLQLDRGSLTEFEQNEAQRLELEKYATQAWNGRR